ncbi:MAG: Ig-like domain-containing protein [Myxococcota bacterium]
MGRRFILFALALGALACGDESSGTFVVASLDAEPGIAERIERVVVRVGGRAASEPAFPTALDVLLDRSGGELSFPFDTGLTPSGGDASRFFLWEAQAFDAGGASIGLVRARGSFQAGRTFRLERTFSGGFCESNPCEDDQTCEGDRCVSDDVGMPPADLGTMDLGVDLGEDMGTPDMGRTLVSIAIAPDTFVLSDGDTLPLEVVGTFADDTTTVLGEDVSFESSAEDVLRVTDAGVVSGVAVGEATVTATVGELSAQATGAVLAQPFVLFSDELREGVAFGAFEGSTNTIEVTSDEAFDGTSSLEARVPAEGYTGGSWFAEVPEDASIYDAVTFYVRASVPDRTLDVAGATHDVFDAGRAVELGGIPLTTLWVQHIVPLPDPSRLEEASGLFHFAEGSDEGEYSIFFDEIRLVDFPPGAVGDLRPSLPDEAQVVVVDETIDLRGECSITVEGREIFLPVVGRQLFDLVSSEPAVVDLDEEGFLVARAPGVSVISGDLAGVPSATFATVAVREDTGPTGPAPTPPRRGADDVVSIFSDAYTNVPVDVLLAPFSLLDFGSSGLRTLAPGDEAHRYATVDFFAIETTTSTVDLSGMTHVHFDVWLEAAAPDALTLKLVDFGADGDFEGGDDSEAELRWDDAGTRDPALEGGRWISVDVPLTTFEAGGGFDVGPGLSSREHMAQYIFTARDAGAFGTLWLDNLYFYRER